MLPLISIIFFGFYFVRLAEISVSIGNAQRLCVWEIDTEVFSYYYFRGWSFRSNKLIELRYGNGVGVRYTSDFFTLISLIPVCAGILREAYRVPHQRHIPNGFIIFSSPTLSKLPAACI